jgi:hypothetical protein
MLLSTSNSRVPDRSHIVLLLAVCALFCASLEAVTTVFFGRISHIEHRREAEYRAAVAMRSAKDSHGASVLVAGNSLLLEGVSFPQLQQDFGPEIELRRTVVENTFYLDWYYGLRRLFKMGSQPDVVVLLLNPLQLTSGAIDGDYTAHFLVDRQDLPALATIIGADRNRMSSLALANLSYFYGTRAEIRTWILGNLLPDLPSLTRLLQFGHVAPEGEAFRQIAAQRLIQLRQLCEQHGVALVVVIPPAREDSGASAVLQAAATSGVKVLIPIGPGALPASDYADNFHLNSHGAGKFTPALADGLKQVFSDTAREQRETASVPSAAASLGQLDSASVRAVPEAPSLGDSQ